MVFIFTRLDSMIVFVALIGAILAVAAAALLGKQSIRVLITLGAIYLIAMPLIIELLPSPAEIADAVAASGLNPNETHRLYIWSFTTERILEHPWLGWGMDAARSLDPEHQTVPWGAKNDAASPTQCSFADIAWAWVGRCCPSRWPDDPSVCIA